MHETGTRLALTGAPMLLLAGGHLLVAVRLGARFLFSGDELADIITFVHNDEAQHGFSRADLTPEARKMMHHEHGAPGGGPKAHAEELGHVHGGKHAD